jgi:hypothetical protein
MLSFDDPRWNRLKAGYRMPIDLRPILQRLESDKDPTKAWHELREELYHQGDVGEGSFVAVPHIVRIHRLRGIADCNAYALAATIELARGTGSNPDVPAWALDDYNQALRELARIGLEELPRAPDQETVHSILSLLAIVYGARTYGRILLTFSEEEVLELERQAFGP